MMSRFPSHSSTLVIQKQGILLQTQGRTEAFPPGIISATLQVRLSWGADLLRDRAARQTRNSPIGRTQLGPRWFTPSTILERAPGTTCTTITRTIPIENHSIVNKLELQAQSPRPSAEEALPVLPHLPITPPALRIASLRSFKNHH